MKPNDDNAETTDEKTWDRTMNINVKGVWWGCRCVVYNMSAFFVIIHHEFI